MSIGLNQRLPAAARAKLSAQMSRDYAKGLSVRGLAAKYGTSLGRVRRLLIEAEVEFRPRGGAHRETARQTPRPAKSHKAAQSPS